MARRMVDEDGNLKSFERWAEDVKPIADHQCRRWLRTEYDTAVKRASLAADWQQFEDEKDVLPNLRWVPSTAAVPDAFHQSMWNTVLPVDHPFWSGHHPGDRWGCQCSLEATDDLATDVPEADYKTSPGLDNNPGIDAKLFSDSHPYFPDSCDSCPFRGAHPVGPTNLAKDCYHCQYAEAALPGNKKETFTPDKEFGQRLMISTDAHPLELEENIRVARELLSAFPDVQMTIRAHVNLPKTSNPEYTIDGLLADRKTPEGAGGITNGFSKGVNGQHCRALVFDLDSKMGDKPLPLGKLACKLKGRRNDFVSGDFERCYLTYHKQFVLITREDYAYSDEELKSHLLKILSSAWK